MRRFLFITAALAALVPLRLSAQRQRDVDLLRTTVLELQAENDSLRRELSRLMSDNAVSTWDRLSGLEDDDDGMPIGNPYGFATEGRSPQLLAEVRAAAPSLGDLTYNPAIERYIGLYTVTKKRTMEHAMGRYAGWLPVFREAFRRHGVPEDVMALAIVESAVSPKAVSKAGAVGMWQFMAGTAKDYGLRVDALVDERMDAVAASDAAARYLKDARARFGTWALAVASYNCGTGNVRRAVVKSGAGADIWKVLSFLPAETQAYLPSLIAARYALVFGDTAGMAARSHPRPATVRIRFGADAQVMDVCSTLGLKAAEFYELNPHILGKTVPADGCWVNIPAGKEAVARKKFGKAF